MDLSQGYIISREKGGGHLVRHPCFFPKRDVGKDVTIALDRIETPASVCCMVVGVYEGVIKGLCLRA